jgi:WD40 repeat protein
MTLKVWDLETGRVLRTLEGHSWCVNSVAIAADGKWEISASEDKTLNVWNMHAGRTPLRTLAGHSDSVSAVAVSPDGKLAVSASWDHTLKVWNLDTGRAVRTLEGHSNRVQSVAMMPDGKRVLSASEDKTLRLWDLDTGLHIVTFDCDAPAGCCACGGDRRVVAGDAGGRVYFLALEE